MAVGDAADRLAPRTSPLNDPLIRGIAYQALVVVIILGGGYWLIGNAIANLAAQGKNMGFDFLWRTAGFEISFSLVPLSRASYYWELFVAGLVNTILVSVITIVLASIFGFLLGMARLSSNWIVAKLAAIYVEVTRNIPLLLWLFVWYFAVLKALPAVRESLAIGDVLFLNQRGIFLPAPVFDDRFVWVVAAFALAIVGGIALRYWAKARLEATGKRFAVLGSFIGLVIVLPTLALVFSGTNVGLDLPALKGFNFQGGIDVPPELGATVVAMTLYAATFIGEIVRSGIQAISHGQTEAAQALGLKNADRLRLVILPQALRVIIPPLSSEYLNVIKNSSLAAAVGYPELVNVFAGTALNQTGRAFEIIGMTMAVYLTLSLLTSAFMNWFNANVALVER